MRPVLLPLRHRRGRLASLALQDLLTILRDNMILSWSTTIILGSPNYLRSTILGYPNYLGRLASLALQDLLTIYDN